MALSRPSPCFSHPDEDDDMWQQCVNSSFSKHADDCISTSSGASINIFPDSASIFPPYPASIFPPYPVSIFPPYSVSIFPPDPVSIFLLPSINISSLHSINISFTQYQYFSLPSINISLTQRQPVTANSVPPGFSGCVSSLAFFSWSVLRFSTYRSFLTYLLI